jgi:hypothetical protein
MPRDQVLGVADVLRAVLAVVPPTDRAPSLHGSPREVVGSATVIDPCLVEAVGVDAQPAFGGLVPPVLVGFGKRRAILRRVGVCAVVPFAEDARAVTVRLERLGDGRFFLGQLAARLGPGADAETMPCGHQHRAGGRADTPSHEVIKAKAFLAQPVDARRRDAAAVGAQITPTQVIGQQIDHVGSFGRIERSPGRQQENGDG